jgi:tetratricopeptide (TPR) repeat protein
MHGVHRTVTTVVITLLLTSLLVPRLGSTCESTKSRQVADLLVANQVAAAEALLDHFAEQQPDDPMLAIYRGAVLWAKAKNASKAQKPEAQQKAVDALQQVIDGESQTLQADPEQPQRQLSLGIAEALVARIYMQQKKWFKAYRYGRRARDGLRELVAQHPEREDAYLVLGLYEYHAGTIPPIWKWAAAMLDFAGDAQLGIQYLERAIQNAPIVAPEAARVLLTEIKPPQSQACDYLPLAQYMREHYGTNLRFSVALQDLYIMCGQPQKTLTEVRYAKKRFLQQHPRMQIPLDIRTLVAYRELGDVQQIDAMATQLKSRPLIWTLNKAKTADIIGDRDTATDLYETLIDDDHAPRWIQKQAQQYRKQPYQRFKTQHPQREIVLNTHCS